MTANTFPSTNNKISNLVNSQVPFFVRNDHLNFVKFLEAYYEWLEQTDGSVSGIANTQQYNVITRIKELPKIFDVDTTSSQFVDYLYSHFMALIPKNVQVDKALLLKNIKDFYRAKGTEKATQLLLNILFGEDKQVQFYYPKRDVLRASDGKWFIEKSIKISQWQVNGIPNTNPTVLNYFANNIVTGNTSKANAIVEKIESYFEGGLPVKEIKISSQKGDFDNGETLFTTFIEDGVTKSLTATIFGGLLSSTEILVSGNGYTIGTEVPIVSNTGSNGSIIISSVSTGNISSIGVVSGGAGFKANDSVLFTGGGGTGGFGNVLTVLSDSSVHPNSYNIVFSTIQLEANTIIGNAVYSNLNSSIVDPANDSISNSMSYFSYDNVGPVQSVYVISPGTGYTSVPILDTQANTRVRSLGILGRMEIVNGGVGYEANDKINFINVIGGYGSGALGNVVSVNATGSITNVEFIPISGHITGGTGYTQTYLPIANVVSSNTNAYGANIAVTAILGDGEELKAVTTSIGQILGLRIISGGSNYDANTTLDLTNLGDGTAQVSVTIVQGTFTYPGRWLNDDGHVSSYNFLQDRDYYQNFSYVVKLNETIEKYRKALLQLTHPMGTKLFGEYLSEDYVPITISPVPSSERYIQYESQPYYVAVLNANVTPGITISMNTYGLSQNSEVFLGFGSGNIASYDANSIYYVSNVINSNAVLVYTGTKIPASINVANWETNPRGITFRDDGKIMYVVGGSSDIVVMYDLQYPWDISSAKFKTGSATVGDETPSGVTFSSNGKFMYISGITTQTIRQFSLTESWNVNAASLITTYNVSPQDGSPQDLYIGNNGTILYVIGLTNDRVYQYNLGTAWNVNTAVYTSNISVAAQDTSPRGLYFKDDGTIMYVTGDINDRIYQYSLSEAWNVQSAVYTTNTASLNSIDSVPQSVFVGKQGTMLYFTGSTNDLVVQAPLREAWNVSTMVLDMFNTVAANSGNVFVSKPYV